MKRLILILFCSLSIISNARSQEDVRLDSNDPKNKKTLNVKLYDADNGDFLMELPMTFHIMKGKKRNLLFLILGKEKNKRDPQTIWLFREFLRLDDLLKKNKNLTANKQFKKKYTAVDSFYAQSENIRLTDFPDNYEKVEEVPKPLFFEIKDLNKPIELKLNFYISKRGKDENMQELTYKTGAVKITINITN